MKTHIVRLFAFAMCSVCQAQMDAVLQNHANGVVETKTIYVYDDVANYPWSGFMGTANGSSITLDLYYETYCVKGVYCVRMASSGLEDWCGIVIQCRPDLWLGPGVDLSGVRSVTFWARGERGGENIEAHFMDDSYIQYLTLSTQWVEYTQPISSNLNVSSVRGLLSVVIPTKTNMALYLDEICMEFSRPQFLSNGTFPEFVRGICYNSSDPARLVYDLNMIITGLFANTLRFWGQTDVSPAMLDVIAARNLNVILPYWLPRTNDFSTVKADYTDGTLCAALLRSISNYLAFYLPHPSVVAVVFGNEVFNNLKPDTPSNNAAFAQFLDSACRDTHREFPQMKTTYAAAGIEGLSYLATYTTNIDIYGCNAYGSIGQVITNYYASGYGEPLLFLEYACSGWWETAWSSYSDSARANDYTNHWYLLRDNSLGGCAFTWLDKIENAYTGWGIVNNDRTPRPQYYAIAAAYDIPELSTGVMMLATGIFFNLTYRRTLRTVDSSGKHER